MAAITLPDGAVPVRWRAVWIEDDDVSVEGAVVLRSDGFVLVRANRRDGVKCRDEWRVVTRVDRVPVPERRATVLARLTQRGYALSS